MHEFSIKSGNQYLIRIQQLAVGVAELPESAVIELAINGMSQNLRPHVISRNPKIFNELRQSVEIANNILSCNPFERQALNSYCSQNVTNSCTHNHNNHANANPNFSANDISALCSSLAESFKSIVRQEVMSMQTKPQIQERQNLQYDRR